MREKNANRHSGTFKLIVFYGGFEHFLTSVDDSLLSHSIVLDVFCFPFLATFAFRFRALCVPNLDSFSFKIDVVNNMGHDFNFPSFWDDFWSQNGAKMALKNLGAECVLGFGRAKTPQARPKTPQDPPRPPYDLPRLPRGVPWDHPRPSGPPSRPPKTPKGHRKTSPRALPRALSSPQDHPKTVEIR